MKVISIGDLVLDYYYKNNILVGVNGGITSHNIVANLAKMGINTAVYGVCGNDSQGKVALKSLEQLGVDVKKIKTLEERKTRCFHVSYFEKDGNLEFESKKRCPYCKNKRWYEESFIDEEYIINDICDDDILVFDNLNSKNQKIIDCTKNKKVIDLGQYFELEKIDKKDIIDRLQNKFEYINLNERVSNYLIERFKVKNNLELYEILNPKLMTITKGSKGASFLYKGNEYNFELYKKTNVVDSTGAGDAFTSVIIKEIIKKDFIYDFSMFDIWYKKTNNLTSKVVSKMGSRGHLLPMFKIKKLKEECTCNDFTVTQRKKIKRCNININNLEKRVINAINAVEDDKLNNINFEKTNSCLFVGAGGSFAGAHFVSRIINHLYGCNTYAVYPRDVLYRNNDKIDKVVLFSYSGTTSDLISCTKTFDSNKVYLVTKGELQKITMKTPILKKNIVSYRSFSNKGKERGFLSFEGAVSPAAIFLKHYLKNHDISPEDFIKKSISYWKVKINELISNSNIKKYSKVINIFRGDYADSAAYDLESKIVESGIYNCIIHEKKNFSHGRFINYENLKNSLSIYFKPKTTTEYEEELLKYLEKEIILIESEYDGILAEFDLLIASQFIIYYIGKELNVDVSKPSYKEEAMKIYFYKGNL